MWTERLPRERLAELVGAAAYGSVLVLAALAAISASDVAVGHGTEVVAGVGAATWIAHLFSELVAGHVRHTDALERAEIRRVAVDGSPILVATLLPAAVLLLGRVDLITDTAARLLAIAVAIGQLFAIGAVVAQRTTVGTSSKWLFALVTASVGIAVVVVTVVLGH
jgi:hypothetical protein